MKKKIFLSLICGLLILGLTTGCNKNESNNKTNTNNNLDNSNTNNNIDNNKFDNSFEFVGYNFKYPNDYSLSNSNYGKSVGSTDKSGDMIYILVETPTAAGITDDTVSNLDDCINVSENYIIKSLERKLSAWLNVGKTELSISNKINTKINGIPMIKVNGSLINKVKNTSFNYTAYYFLDNSNYFLDNPNGNSYPFYMFGVQLDDNTNIETFMDNFVSQISKNNNN